jgi:phosphoribosylformylglycinamidine cyclo-ligase
VGEELLEPTRIYAQDCLALAATVDVHAISHVTGGGIAANLARVLPTGLAVDVDRGTWRPPAVFALIERNGRVDRASMERTFNVGIGMIAVVSADAAGPAVRLLAERGVPAWVCGTVRPRTDGEVGDAAAKGGAGGAVRLVGEHRG